MGFFKDFKRDFAQAVNELMPEKDELAGEYDDEDMVNTFDENDNMEIAPEDMLENIDDYGEDATVDNRPFNTYNSDRQEEDAGSGEEYAPMENEEESENDSSTDNLADVPEAELISEHDFNDLNSLNDMENQSYESENQDMAEDELKDADSLDEPDMLEGTEDAVKLDDSSAGDEKFYGNPFEQIGEDKAELHEMDLLKDIEDVLARTETSEESVAEPVSKAEEEQYNDEYAAGAFPEADQFREDVMAEVEMNSHVSETTKEIDDILEVDTTYITKNTTIRGNLSTEGSVDVLGTVKGNVSCTGKLIIGGTIKGDIDAGDIYANAAKVEGRVIAEGSVKIGVGSVVKGDIQATSAVVAGAVNGDIDVHGPVIVDSTAVIMGNIKSRSVQINNGAVIEGFCSQCYSEIDVKSFFDMESDEDDEEDDKSEKKNEITADDNKENEQDAVQDKASEGKSGKNGRKSNRKSGKNNGNRNNSNKNNDDRDDIKPDEKTDEKNADEPVTAEDSAAANESAAAEYEEEIEKEIAELLTDTPESTEASSSETTEVGEVGEVGIEETDNKEAKDE